MSELLSAIGIATIIIAGLLGVPITIFIIYTEFKGYYLVFKKLYLKNRKKKQTQEMLERR